MPTHRPPSRKVHGQPPRPPSQVEGTCSGRYGFIITVTEVLEHGKGKIREGTPRVCTAGVSALLDAQPFLRKPCGWRTLWSGLPNRPRRPRRDISDAEEVSKRLRSQGAAEQNAPHAKRSTRSAASPFLQPYHASLRLRRRGSGHVQHEVRRVIQT